MNLQLAVTDITLQSKLDNGCDAIDTACKAAFDM